MYKFKSKVGKGSTEFDSARLIIPQQVRTFLEVNPGDSVEWTVDITDNVVTVLLDKLNK